MKVLHLISSAGLYGAESVILTLLHEMRRMGQPCVLGVFLNYANPDVALHEAALQAGFESHLVPCSGQIDRGTVKFIRSLVAGTGATLLHTHGYKADVYGYFALRRGTVPLVSTCHNWCDTDVATRLYGTLDRRCLRHFAAVAAVSADVKGRLEKAGLSPDKVPVIHNGIDCEPFLSVRRHTPESPDDLTVGFVGRLSSEKGVDLFLVAAQGILQQLPGTRFVIAGDGPERGAVEKVMREKGIEDKITLLGRCDNMPEFYSSLDVLLSSSRTEGLPVALMEAMASGVPVVATAVGDVSALVRHERTGILVPALDVTAMQTAIIKLLHDPGKRLRLGEAGSEWIQQNFSSQKMAGSYLSFYQSVLSGPQVQLAEQAG